jgi:hypothetical protein
MQTWVQELKGRRSAAFLFSSDFGVLHLADFAAAASETNFEGEVGKLRTKQLSSYPQKWGWR